MCGIVGYDPVYPSVQAQVRELFGALFRESCVRGKHAYGLASPVLVHRSFAVEDVIAAFDPLFPTVAHARYCQSGDWREIQNNQPIIAHGMALAMNGVIHMGTKEEFEAAFNVRCNADNDGEVFLQLLAAGMTVQEALARIEPGSFAGVWLQGRQLRAVRNARRPLWRCQHAGATWYASTSDIFRRAGFDVQLFELVPGEVWW